MRALLTALALVPLVAACDARVGPGNKEVIPGTDKSKGEPVPAEKQKAVTPEEFAPKASPTPER